MLNILVPCDFTESISIDIGGKSVEISHASFNLGAVSQGSNTCVAGATSDSTLTGSEFVCCFKGK